MTPAQYFSKRRGLANGLVYAGGGAGGTIISVSMNALIAKLGPAWTFRAIGLMTLATGLPAAWFIKERVPMRTASFIEWSVYDIRNLSPMLNPQQAALSRCTFRASLPRRSNRDISAPRPSILLTSLQHLAWPLAACGCWPLSWVQFFICCRPDPLRLRRGPPRARECSHPLPPPQRH